MSIDQEPGAPEAEVHDTERRELLAKIGQFAYVAPALTLLIDPAHAGDYRPEPKKPKKEKD
jgi:hypothetical protein